MAGETSTTQLHGRQASLQVHTHVAQHLRLFKKGFNAKALLYVRPIVYLAEEADYDELYDFLTQCTDCIMRWKYFYDKRNHH